MSKRVGKVTAKLSTAPKNGSNSHIRSKKADRFDWTLILFCSSMTLLALGLIAFVLVFGLLSWGK